MLTDAHAATTSAVRAVRGAENLLASMDEEHDGIVLGFVPDHYLTEYCHPSSTSRRDQVIDVERFRGMGPRDMLARSLLLGGLSFGAVDLSGAPTSAGAELDPAGPALAVATPAVLGRAIQERLAAFVQAGGRLLLHGLVPEVDDDGTPCTVLADALGITVAERVDGTPHFYPSVRATDWAGAQPEVRVGVLEHLASTGASTVEPLILDVADGSPVAVEVSLPSGGRAIVMACDYPCHLGLWLALFDRLGVRPRVVADGATPGLVHTTTADDTGQRLVHLVNVAPVPQAFTLQLNGASVADGFAFDLAARSGLIVPVDVQLDDAVLRWATAELDGDGDGSTVQLRRGDGPGRALLETDREVAVDGDAEVARTDGGWLVSWGKGPGRRTAQRAAHVTVGRSSATMTAVADVVIALDAGGTKLVGGLVGRSGEVFERDQVATPRVAGRCDPGLTALHALAARLGERSTRGRPPGPGARPRHRRVRPGRVGSPVPRCSTGRCSLATC